MIDFNGKYDPAQDYNANLESLCVIGLEDRFGSDVPPDIRKRLEEELRIIKKLNQAPALLVHAEVVSWVHEQGILMTPFGQSANSLVCYLLGISSIDPIKYGLPAARFLNGSSDLPLNIDYYVAESKKDVFDDHFREFYAEERFGYRYLKPYLLSSSREDGENLKLDFVGIQALDIAAYLEKFTLRAFVDIPLSDDAPYELLADADSSRALGLYEGKLGRILQDIHPKNLVDVAAGFALAHKSAFDSGLAHRFLRAASNAREGNIENIGESNAAYAETYGVPIFQEQVINLAVALGFDPDSANDFRLALCHRESGSYRNQFFSLAGEAGFALDETQALWVDLTCFGDAFFVKAHALSLASILVRLAWAKVYFPKEYELALAVAKTHDNTPF